jgi:hypothetical protein
MLRLYSTITSKRTISIIREVIFRDFLLIIKEYLLSSSHIGPLWVN